MKFILSRLLNQKFRLALLIGGGGGHVIITLLFHFWTPTGADIWWLLKELWSAQSDGMHPTGMLSSFLFSGIF